MLEIFKEIREVKVFMSEKNDGNMRLFSSGFDLNRKKYLTQEGFDYENLISAKLEHGSNVIIVKNLESLESQKGLCDYCDGLITQNPELILSITSADCFPVFLFDSQKKVIGVLHCGWRSTAKGIIENALAKLNTDFNTDFKDISVGIGPGIQKCHFEVEDNLLKNFGGYEKFISNKNGKKYFDLAGVIKDKFISKGVREEKIEIDKQCSYCNDNFWSYRRGNKGVDEIEVAIAGIKLS